MSQKIYDFISSLERWELVSLCVVGLVCLGFVGVELWLVVGVSEPSGAPYEDFDSYDNFSGPSADSDVVVQSDGGDSLLKYDSDAGRVVVYVVSSASREVYYFEEVSKGDESGVVSFNRIDEYVHSGEYPLTSVREKSLVDDISSGSDMCVVNGGGSAIGSSGGESVGDVSSVLNRWSGLLYAETWMDELSYERGVPGDRAVDSQYSLNDYVVQNGYYWYDNDGRDLLRVSGDGVMNYKDGVVLSSEYNVTFTEFETVWVGPIPIVDFSSGDSEVHSSDYTVERDVDVTVERPAWVDSVDDSSEC